MIRNRSYRARGGMVSVSEVLDELIERAADRRRKKRSGRLQRGLQLELFTDQPVPRDAERPLVSESDTTPRDADRPLFDLLPGAYEGL